jgi:pimeloyl-ACP methyl ester carboxylesterase
MNDASHSSGSRRRAIVLVPGVKREERFFRRDTLVSNLETVETFPVSRGDAVEVAGDIGVRLTARPLRSGSAPHGPDLDVFEAHWADMVPEQVELGPWQKLGNGLDMLAYWLLSWRTWQALSVSRYITLGLMIGGLLLVLWYVALVLVVADAVTKDVTLAAGVRDVPVLGNLLQMFLDGAGMIGRWYWWALIACVLSVVPVDALVQMARFAKDYLENRPDESEVGLRDRMRNRVRATLENVLEAGYDEVVLVAHSFGSVLAIDLLADWPHRDDFARLRLVTLGSPIAVLGYRSKWLDAERRQLLQRPELETWLDFYAPTDWLCTAVPGHADRYQDMSRKVDFEAPLRQMLTGQTHMLYYRCSEVLETLAAPLGQRGAAGEDVAQASYATDHLPDDRAIGGRAWPGRASSRSRA